MWTVSKPWLDRVPIWLWKQSQQQVGWGTCLGHDKLIGGMMSPGLETHSRKIILSMYISRWWWRMQSSPRQQGWDVEDPSSPFLCKVIPSVLLVVCSVSKRGHYLGSICEKCFTIFLLFSCVFPVQFFREGAEFGVGIFVAHTSPPVHPLGFKSGVVCVSVLR